MWPQSCFIWMHLFQFVVFDSISKITMRMFFKTHDTENLYLNRNHTSSTNRPDSTKGSKVCRHLSWETNTSYCKSASSSQGTSKGKFSLKTKILFNNMLRIEFTLCSSSILLVNCLDQRAIQWKDCKKILCVKWQFLDVVQWKIGRKWV